MAYRKRLLIFYIALFVLAAPVYATGGTITVTATVDEYDDVTPNATCSLREAITAVNTGDAFGGCPAGDVVLLTANQTYALTRSGLHENGNTSGDLDLSASVNLITTGNPPAVIDAATVGDRVLDVISGTLTLSNVILTNGVAPSGGGLGGGGLQVGIGQAANLDNVIVISNSAGINGVGGGIANRGNLTINHSSIQGNAADVFEGGGVYNTSTLIISNTSLISNTAPNGGGLWHAAGSASLRNVTVSGNLAQGDGGGIYNSATLTLNNVTLTNNSVSGGDGGGLAGSFTTGTNTVIAANLDGALPNKPDCATTLNSGGYNLVQVTTGCTLIGNVATVISNTAPNLSGLGMFSGLTLTHLPLSNSPAIDAGNPATPNGVSPNCEILDQRGYARQSSRCDIGAVESDGLSQSVYLPLILR